MRWVYLPRSQEFNLSAEAREDTMKFSIVITTYNRLDLLRRAIASSLAQTVPCEVVVVDDCSSDDTEAYVRSLGDRVIYHRNAINQGHSAAVNTGVQKASGNWIKPLDDDDYLAPNCIEVMQAAIAQRPEAVLCSCQAAQVNEQEIELSCTRRVGTSDSFYVPQEDIHYGMLLERLPFGTPVQVAFQREAFLRSGGWDSSLDTNCDDIDSWIRIAQFGDAIFLNHCLAYRTVWPNAYNRQFSLQKRFETNLLMKQKIHEAVSPKYRHQVPSLATIRDYLKLHWSFVALKQRKLWLAIALIGPVIFSWPAWQLLLQARAGGSHPTKQSAQQIQQIPLRDRPSEAVVAIGSGNSD